MDLRPACAWPQKEAEMKYIVIEKPGAVSVKEMEMPVRRKGEALLRLLYGGICGSDLNSYRGGNAYVKYPVIPGHEFSAEIAEIDENPYGLTRGMLVTANPYFNCGSCYPCAKGRVNCCTDNQTMGVQRDGGFAEYITMPLDRLYACEALLPWQAARVEPFCIGYHGIKRAGIEKRERVLVVGAGSIGVFAAISAKLRGAEVTVCDIAEEKLHLTQEYFGADHTILNGDSRIFLEQVNEITGGRGFDVTVEAVGIPSTFLNCVDAAAFGGRVVVIGVSKSNADFNFTLIQKKELCILGSRNALKADFMEVIGCIREQRAGNLDKIVTKTYHFTEAAEAFEDLDRNAGHILKTALRF